MLNMVARLSRALPLLIALALLAVIIYFIVSWRSTPTRAKDVLIRVFMWLTSIISGVFILFSLYALLDSNTPAFELAASFAAVGLIGLAVTLICRWRFRKNHPHYKHRPNAKASTQGSSPVKAKGTFWWIYDIVGRFRPKG